MINSFSGDYRFLSNFYPCVLHINEYKFKNSEAAYQAMKSEDPKDWIKFQYYDAATAKKAGRLLVIRPEWDEIKLQVMREILDIKFSITELMMLLINTRPHELIEANYWGDTYWGVCRGKGQNHLGKLLMEIREEKQGDFSW